jgi:hypothetical protein
MIRYAVVIWLLMCSVAVAQYNTQAEVKPIEAQVVMADAATVYQTGERVAVVLQKPDPKPSLGAVLEIKSDAKWVSVQAGPTFESLRALSQIEAGKYLLVGQAGKYLVLIVESSPDGPPVLQFLSVSLGAPQPEPDNPSDPPPPGGFAALTELVKQSVGAMNEPRVASALLQAYSQVAENPGLQLGDASKARQAALLNLRGVTKPWNVEFDKWEAEIKKVGVGDLVKYRESLRAIVAGLKGAGVTAATAVRYRQVCIDGVCYWVAE